MYKPTLLQSIQPTQRLYLLLLLALLITAPASAATPQGASENQVFRDWTVVCERTPESEQEVCGMVQNLVLQETGQSVIQLIVRPEGEGHAAILTLPLGIDLLPGVTLQIDQQESQNIPVRTCRQSGCLAAWEITPDWLDGMRRGANLTVTLATLDGQGLDVAISLAGFTAAYNHLTAQ